MNLGMLEELDQILKYHHTLTKVEPKGITISRKNRSRSEPCPRTADKARSYAGMTLVKLSSSFGGEITVNAAGGVGDDEVMVVSEAGIQAYPLQVQAWEVVTANEAFDEKENTFMEDLKKL